MVINLGIGIPTLCANFIPLGREILFHSENGVIGFGEIIENPNLADPTLINAGSQPVLRRPGMAIVDQAESFAVIRGGHLDLAVLGAFQVSEQGDLANTVMPGKSIGSIGGAQDLAFCAKRVIVAMTHVDRDGRPKIVRRCTSPVTAPRCVNLIVTDIAVIAVSGEGLTLLEYAPGWSVEEIQALTEPHLRTSPTLREIELL